MAGLQVAKEINHSGLKFSGWKEAMGWSKPRPFNLQAVSLAQRQEVAVPCLTASGRPALEARSFDSQSSDLSTTQLFSRT